MICSVLDEHVICSVLDEHVICSVLDEHVICSVLDEHVICSVLDEHVICSVLDEHDRLDLFENTVQVSFNNKTSHHDITEMLFNFQKYEKSNQSINGSKYIR